jgi:hypothetical protein
MAIALDAVGGGQVLETDADEFEVAIRSGKSPSSPLTACAVRCPST